MTQQRQAWAPSAQAPIPSVDTVDPSIYTDPAIFELERERIFDRSWNFLGHVTEVVENGSFVVRMLVGNSVIVVRGNDGQLRAFYNVCRHRGMQVCRADDGRLKRFTCPYHGWMFSIDGDLTSVPLDRPYFGTAGIDRSQYGLTPIPRFEIFHGLMFGSLDPQAPSLEDYLGDFGWYLSIYLDRDPQGMEVIGEPQRWRLPCNWKIPSENVMGDTYHVQSTHRSVFEVGLHPNQPKDFSAEGSRNGVHIDGGNGTCGLTRQSASGRGYPDDLVAMFRENLPGPQRDLVFGPDTYWPSRAHVFPNFSMLNAGAYVEDGLLVPFLFLRIWQPIDVDTVEAWSWVLVEKSASPEFKELSERAYLLTFGPAGTEEVDDAENFASLHRVLRGGGHGTPTQVLHMGSDEQMRDWHLADWEPPGVAIATTYSDAGNKKFHQLWSDAMAGVWP